MIFNSYKFLLFFLMVVIIYYLMDVFKLKKFRYILLLIASYYFYMSWNPSYALLILLSTIITYVSGIILERVKSLSWNERKKRRGQRLCVLISLLSNLGILVYFKYFNFFISVIEEIAIKLHMSIELPTVDVLLPVGISFYTFQALSYTMDVYRDDIRAENNFLKYALFVSFFPQLVAGPIERSQNLIRQINELHKVNLDYEEITSGTVLMLYGFFLKIVIADKICIFVDTVFNSYWKFGSVELILAAVGFAIQIYCDFSGYSLIAVGAARILGVKLMKNFDCPYFAVSIKEFWRRWHISLSSWFRDYLYIPLGGGRYGKAKKYRNLLVVFAVSGLWHGADWTYIVWGCLHGFYQVAENVLEPISSKMKSFLGEKSKSISYKMLRAGMTFLLVDFGWIFFRSESIRDALMYIKLMFTRWDIWNLFNRSLYQWGITELEFKVLFVAVAVMLLIDLIQYKKKVYIDVFMRSQILVFRWGFYIFVLLFIIIFGSYGPNVNTDQFIYFQF